VEACNQIHHLGHRAKRLISSILVLINDELIRVIYTGMADRWDRALFVCTKDPGDEIEQIFVR
jgi:hypothetical protein